MANNSLPINATLDYNNFGSRFVGRDRFGVAFDVGNLIKEGAILSARGVMGSDPDKMLYGRGAYSIPLNTLGTKSAFITRMDIPMSVNNLKHSVSKVKQKLTVFLLRIPS